MNLQVIKDTIQRAEYSFLKTDVHLGPNIVMLVIAGSYGYGTSVDTSDIDLRGVTVELPRDLLGLSSFEQFQDAHTDTVIFGLKKFVRLCLKANPAALEILGSHDDFCLQSTAEGKLLRDNIQLFLSKKVIDTFGNYAVSQLKKFREKLFATNELYDAKLHKHAMHVIRVLMTGKDILEGKGMQVFRDKERDVLMYIRQGDYTIEEFNALVSQLRSDFNYACVHTTLPENPDYDAVEELLMYIYYAHWRIKKG